MECITCKKKFTGLENYNKHLQSEDHKQKIRQNDLPAESKAAASSNSNFDGTIKCNVCDLSFKDFESFQDHSVTPEHALKIMLKQAASDRSANQNSAMTNHEFNAMKSKMEVTDNDSILPELNKSPDLSYGKCELCAKMFSGPEPYKQHLESQAHKKKVSQQNPTYAAGNVLKCEPCNKSFSGEVPYTQHMVSETHRKKLQNIQLIENFIRANSSGSQAGMKEHAAEKEDSHIAISNIADSNKIFFCNICQKECSGMIPYQQHLNGSTHLKNERRSQFMASLMQQQLNKVPEASANGVEVVDGSCEIDNGKKEKDCVFTEKIDELQVVNSDELEKLVKVIPPDEEIKFDHVDMPEESALTKQDENQSDEISSTLKKMNENGLEKTEEENKCYETHKF